MFKALANIPDWVGHAARYHDLYESYKPEELIQKTAQLCSAVLVALRSVLLYLEEGTMSKSSRYYQLRSRITT